MAPTSWSRLFRIIWRINGVAILLLLTLSIIGLSGTLLSGVFSSSQSKEPPSPNVAPSEAGKPELRLGGFERIYPTSVVKAELRESASGDSFSFKGSDHATIHNVLFFDTNDGKSWWLLPNSNSTIEAELPISLPNNGQETNIAILYKITDPSEKQKSSSLVLTDPKGLKKINLFSGNPEIDEVITFSTTDAKVLFHDAVGYHVISVNPSETTKVRETPIPFTYPPQK